MDRIKIEKYLEHYKASLLEDTLPFWVNRCQDRKYGGFLTYLDREGNRLSDEKNGWVQGRMTWMFSRLFNEIEKNQKWLNLAKSGYEFLRDHILDEQGRGWFTVSRKGNPVRRRRYLFVEAFAVIACAEYYRATENTEALHLAQKVLHRIYALKDGGTDSKYHKSIKTRGHSLTMILISVLQILRTSDSQGQYNEKIDIQIEEIFKYFVHKEKKCLFETVGPQGEFIDNPAGKTINPGHAIETAWFIMQEAEYRNDARLLKTILPVLDWHLELGWDKKYGGLNSFVSYGGGQPEQIEWNMKYWWPHNEALYATLLAHYLTGDTKYADWFDKIHNWSERHFPDKEKGEWFGYLNYDGTVSNTLKGNNWKSCFHLQRQQLFTWQLLEKMKQGV